MDAFSEILSGVKLNGALFFCAEFSAPWCFSSPASNTLAPILAPGAPHLVIYHFVIDGGAFVQLADGQSVDLGPGDVVVLPHGDPHIMTSSRGVTATSLTYGDSFKVRLRDLSPMQAGGGGDPARFVCGFMACDPSSAGPSSSGLPPVFKVNIRTIDRATGLRALSCIWSRKPPRDVSAAMRCSPSSRRPFSSTPCAATLQACPSIRLDGSRAHATQSSGKASDCSKPRCHPWTIADLADKVGISRSALVERFTRYLSEPPMTYLTRWRLQLAARSLESTPRGVAEIAGEVGYESEAAFNRAFKREFGQPPGIPPRP